MREHEACHRPPGHDGVALLVSWAVASPVLAAVPDDGDEPGAA